jgi:hypothetical protein
MYNDRPNLMLGFHGCDESVVMQLITNPDEVKISQETLHLKAQVFRQKTISKSASEI